MFPNILGIVKPPFKSVILHFPKYEGDNLVVNRWLRGITGAFGSPLSI